MRAAAAAVSVALLAAPAVGGGPFGLARLPPMGWRSWNAFHGGITQDMMQDIMDRMAVRNRTVDGKPTSLLDVGYINVGLDDNWQACGEGVNGSFHDANGVPLINKDRFPDMKQMCDHAHNQGLHCGFYYNNCICKENQFKDPAMIDKIYRSSVKALVDYGYDSVKIDGCSQFHNTSYWAHLMDQSGRPILIENCHDSHPTYPTDPNATCPYNWYRTSGDINPGWGKVTGNLHTTTKFQGDPPLSRPGCWAYPDMLEVGNMATYEENRAHFGAWCVVSSPLILGLDLRNDAKVDAVWDIMTNREAIAVSQSWHGHPGRLVKSWTPATPAPGPVLPTPAPAQPAGGGYVYAVKCDAGDATQNGWAFDAASSAITHASLCVDASKTSQLQLKPCAAGSAAQQFALAAPYVKHGTACLDIWAGHGLPGGPAVQIYKCHGSQDEQFSFQGGRVENPGGLCLAARAEAPPGPAPAPPTGGGSLQLWMKPQAGGAVAAFLFSDGASNSTATVTFADLGMKGGAVKVRDIWARKDLGTHTGSFATDEVGGNDSRFYLLTPA